jgi:hypothetical protein
MKQRMVINFLVVLLSGAAAPYAAGFESFGDALKSAQQKSQKKDYAGVRTDAGEALGLATTASAKLAAHRLIATSWLNEKNGLTNALAEYETVLALPELTAAERAVILTDMAKAHQNTAAWGAAIAAYERILADPKADNRMRIAALNGIAGNQIDQWNLKGADATVRKALDLPDLKPEERLLALGNVGGLDMRQGRYEAAREWYGKMRPVSTNVVNQLNVDRLMTAAWLGENRFDKAEELNRPAGHELELSAVYQKQERNDEAREVLREWLAAQGEKPSPVAFGQLLKLSRDILDFPSIRKDAEAFLPRLTASDPGRTGELFVSLKEAMEKGNYAFAAWAAPVVMTATNLLPRDYALTRVYRVNALAALDRLDEVKAAAQASAIDTALSASDRLRFALTAAALDPAVKPEALKPALERALASAKGDELAAKDKATALLQAGRSAMMAGREAAARELLALYQGLLAKPEPRVYACAFVDRAPSDPGGWLQSPLLKDVQKKARMDRKVSGENLEMLLATDAISANRAITAQGQAGAGGETETDFYVVCDPDGITFFFLASDSRADEVSRGLVSGGSYEGYLAAGPGQPYYTFLVDLATGALSEGFRTMYPNRLFRMARTADQTMRSLTVPVDKGFATTLFYSWELFYDRIPENGDAWQFDNIRWARSGGYSWAGSQSVHNRSSWGDIVFAGLDEKARREIKRRLIYKAYAKYKKESNFKVNGDIVRWQDPELGDPEFYAALLAPWVGRANRFGEKVGKDMSDADVDLLFKQAVPDWMAFKYLASDMRAAYLSEKYFPAASP